MGFFGPCAFLPDLPGSLPVQEEQDRGSSPHWGDPLEEGLATHSGILARRLPRTEEPVGFSPRGRRESTQLSD